MRSSGLQHGPFVQMMPSSTFVTRRSGSSRQRPQIFSSSLSSMPPAKKRPRRSHLPSFSRVRGCSALDMRDEIQPAAVEIKEVEAIVERQHGAAAATQRQRADVVVERPVCASRRCAGPAARSTGCPRAGRCRPANRGSLPRRPTRDLRRDGCRTRVRIRSSRSDAPNCPRKPINDSKSPVHESLQRSRVTARRRGTVLRFRTVFVTSFPEAV